MKCSAFVTSVVVAATTTIASATPKADEAGGRVSYADSKDSAKQDAPRSPDQWVELADATPASHTNEFIVVGKDAGDFAQLRIAAMKGNTLVRHVRIDFADGKSKIIKVGSLIREHGRTNYALVDLGSPQRIERIVVSTESGKGQYAVYGSSGVDTEGGTVSSR